MTQKATPEEKLFAIIQGVPHPPVRAKAHALSLKDFGGQVKMFLATVDVPRVNSGLMMLVGLLVVWCALAPFTMRPNLDRVISEAQLHAKPFAIAAPLDGAKSLDDHLALLRQKDPFRVEPPPAATPSTVETPPAPPPPNFHGALANLKLVGISWGEDPTAMIEETDTKQTHFLRAGNTIGPFTVKEVKPDRVLLHAGDQDLELF